MVENWQLFRDAQFDLLFRYPRSATDGDPVERVETQREGLFRVHVLSPASRDVYFEVSKYVAISAEEEYRRHQETLSEQSPELLISDLKETVCAFLPAYEYTFKWSEGTRTVILVERENATYRILFNPRYHLNFQILSTVEWPDLT